MGLCGRLAIGANGGAVGIFFGVGCGLLLCFSLAILRLLAYLYHALDMVLAVL